MKYIGILWIGVIVLLTGCKEVTVGYLDTDFAEYVPDSLVVKAILNPDLPADMNRMELKMPWQGTEIEGIEGTFPIFYRIADVKGVSGRTVPEEIARQFRISGKGRIEIGWDHTLPVGTYQVSLEVKNEGYDRIVPDLFRVIVE